MNFKGKLSRKILVDFLANSISYYKFTHNVFECDFSFIYYSRVRRLTAFSTLFDIISYMDRRVAAYTSYNCL